MLFTVAPAWRGAWPAPRPPAAHAPRSRRGVSLAWGAGADEGLPSAASARSPAVAAVNGAALIFDAVLPRVGVRIPALTRDLVLAAAYALGVLAALTSVGVNLSGLVATSAVKTALVALSPQATRGNIPRGMLLQLARTREARAWGGSAARRASSATAGARRRSPRRQATSSSFPTTR